VNSLPLHQGPDWECHPNDFIKRFFQLSKKRVVMVCSADVKKYQNHRNRKASHEQSR